MSKNFTINALLSEARDDDRMLITAYIEGGLLKFKVSCGAQRIRFSDPRRVDTGFRQMIDVALSIEDNGGAIGKGWITRSFQVEGTYKI